ncbi:50S ribosomal protein L10 [Methanofollis aquaemaris]|uniref:Large ribosomal subunit protein uL10 n=1 Tax=Methanofollis aquaemaris TaxID=126734 RepID=A0A8A3S5S6_9EURY|nr:50S ribosomal protein L10 [Methanofollis aquaemaris]QSZ66974.1 50S ribosomal protein L10 [Methanofollis aquaemaris]
MGLYTHHLPAWKREQVEEIKQRFAEYPVVGLVDMHGIPASQLQDIRQNLRGVAEIKMARKTLTHHALNEIGGDVVEMGGHISGQSALIFTKENPFKLYKQLELTKTKMAAKPGETAPEDIVVAKGPTSFKPGPIVGELQQAGVPAMIEGGKVKIRETKTVVKKGEVINAKIAGVLAKLEIKPMDVGLILKAAFQDGTIFAPETLAIDETVYLNQITLAAQQAFNLSVNATILTPLTTETIVGKAAQEARNLAVEACIYEKDVADLIVGRAYREMLAIAMKASEGGFELDESITQAFAAAAAAPAAAAPAAEEAPAEEEEEEEEEKEESGMAGLGALFG